MNHNDKSRAGGVASPGRGQLIRYVLVFQFKLFLDGLRDLLLSPLSLFSALIGVLFRPANPAEPFRRVLSMGRRSEAYVRLFEDPWEKDGAAGLDDVLSMMEIRMREAYRRQGESVKVDAALDALREAVMAARASGPGAGNDDKPDSLR